MVITQTKSLPVITTNRLIITLLSLRLLIGLIDLVFLNSEGILLSLGGLIYEFLTYLLTAILIWRERDHLSDFFIGKLAVFIFIFSKPFQALIGLLGLAPYVKIFPALFFVPVSAGLLLVLWKARPLSLSNPPLLLRWSLVGILSGFAISMFVGYLNTLQGLERGLYTPQDWIILPGIQLTNAAVSEEPLFRGFLWGYLRQRGWNHLPILLVQAGLFWLSHPYHAVLYPLSFWIIIPLGGLFFGLIAWRARDIAPSMFAHGLIDGLGQIFR